MSRIRLDRRRLETAHLKYAMLKTQSRYGATLSSSIPMQTDFCKTLEKFTPLYYEAFTSKYAGVCKILLLSVNIIIMLIAEHTCTFPGCQNVLVLDGNMKNRRDICYAKDAGFVQFPGLPGQIKTGCVASPAFKSRFCTKHDCRSLSSTNSVDKGMHMLQKTSGGLRGG